MKNESYIRNKCITRVEYPGDWPKGVGNTYQINFMEVVMARTERESKVQEKCLKIIRKYGGYVYKNAQSIYTEVGRPDLTACIPTTIENFKKVFGETANVGLFVGIELKRDGHLGEVSEAQAIVGKKIKKSSGIWLAIDDPLVVEALMIKLTEGIEHD